MFATREEANLWEHRVELKYQELMAEKNQLFKQEAEQLRSDFMKTAQLFEDQARKVARQGEQAVQEQCQKEFAGHMAEAARQTHEAKLEADRLRGHAQASSDQISALSNQNKELSSSIQHATVTIADQQAQAQQFLEQK